MSVSCSFKFISRHAELWHSKPVIQYKCTNINIKSAKTSVHTRKNDCLLRHCKQNRGFRSKQGVRMVSVQSKTAHHDSREAYVI